MTKSQCQEVLMYLALIMILLIWFLIYSCVMISRFNSRIDTTQQLIMELDDACPVVTDQQMRA